MDLKNVFKEAVKLAVTIVVSIILLVILAVIIVRIIRFFKYFRVEVVFPKKQITAVYNGAKGESDIDTIWCGTFDLAWNELAEKIGHKVEFENYESDFVNRLNEQNFTKDMLPENDYYIKTDKSSPKLKTEILQSVKDKFGRKENKILDRVNFETDENKMTVYSALNKQFDFTGKFEEVGIRRFGNTNKAIKSFGIPEDGEKELYKNVEVMYYDWKKSESQPNEGEWIYAVRLNATEDEEIILFKTSMEGKLDNIYEEVLKLENEYTGSKEFKNIDTLVVPHINLDIIINYDELCEKEISGTNGINLKNVMQRINISTNPKKNKIYITPIEIPNILDGTPSKTRQFEFNNQCYMFVKEKNKDKPYFAMKLNENFVETIN